MQDRIASNSTIVTVWPTLTNARDYVANIRRKMVACVNKHGASYVKIGVTGTGQKPCYRISYTEDNEAIFGSFWHTHQPLEKEDAQNTNWSTATMSFQEVDAFLKEKTGWKYKA